MSPFRRRLGSPAGTRPAERWIMVGQEDAIRDAWAAFEARPGDRPPVAGLVPVAGDVGPRRDVAPGAPFLRGRADLPQLVSPAGGDHVIIVVSPDARSWLADLIGELAVLPVELWLLPAPCPVADPDAAGFGEDPFAAAFDPAPGRVMVVKRALDFVLGGATLLLSTPLLLISALAVKLDTPGPAMFRQMRVGRGGRLFPMLKFRTMVVAAAAGPNGGEGDEAGDCRPDPKPAHDPRVTRVGRFLRRTSLDELPQLVNVLAGQMSLVGPRPELPRLVAYYTPEQWQRLLVPQGMTGWWQVNGRAEKVMYLCPEDDLYYVRHFSLRLDLLILWKTIGAVIGGRGAY